VLPQSCAAGAISLPVGFPNCWNGRVTGTIDTPDAVYPSSGACPSTHPRGLPRVIVGWSTRSARRPGRSRCRRARPTRCTLGQTQNRFWTIWEQSALDRLVARYLRATTDCGDNPA